MGSQSHVTIRQGLDKTPSPCARSWRDHGSCSHAVAVAARIATAAAVALSAMKMKAARPASAPLKPCNPARVSASQ
jgi:hypothetical protein